jgi:hypothetical protein
MIGVGWAMVIKMVPVVLAILSTLTEYLAITVFQAICIIYNPLVA